jgi:hypothetical protein
MTVEFRESRNRAAGSIFGGGGGGGVRVCDKLSY